MRPMLADSADVHELDSYIADVKWWIEQKFDGQRMLVVIDNGEIKVLNRQGMPKVTNLHPAIVDQFADFTTGQWVFDGELLDGCLQVFDMPQAGGLVAPDTRFAERRIALEALLEQGVWTPDPAYVQLTHCAKTTDDKAKLAKIAQDDQCEGVMLKHVDGAYQPAKRSRRMLKCKFTHDLDAIITAVGHDGKDNAVLSLLDPEAGKVVEIGRASTIGKKPTPAVGDVWLVTYLYFTDADRRLYQPRLVSKRTDKDYSECLVDQLVTTSKRVVDKTRLSS